MNTDLKRLIMALRHALSDAVAPELCSDFARGQLAAVSDILGKLAGMTVWDPQALQEQAKALSDGNRRFIERAERTGLSLPACSAATDLDAAQSCTRELTDWLDANSPALSPDMAAELDAILRQTLRDQLRAERQRTPLTDFSAMTTAANKD